MYPNSSNLHGLTRGNLFADAKTPQYTLAQLREAYTPRPETTVHNIAKKAQINTTRDESQWIVGQSPLSHLQYPDAFKSSARDLSISKVRLLLSDKTTPVFNEYSRSPFELGQFKLSTCLLHVFLKLVENTAYPAWILT